ncbi:DUF3616 domain-containing protein [Mesorhizobium sp. M1148]|uniref:DUF3616 domain-containing protein n=1 Tax=unclassified Mesorhizobium TaxID=325217 RepID=UPI0003CE8B36|nr:MULTISPECIES: DUF3616 domain-containing protein [unclassified Mesorhizobium]ESW84235.1 hypothetical protein X773_09495 [Mesorhizobium sp. LSJC285A00]ESY14999.1 hypothetical protein X750_29770 [Mesorhizobium sp. LNJC394B00]ESZ24337.1 hypothetical protein X733_32210 [Mesorhizobium sp. L2C067A000]
MNRSVGIAIVFFCGAAAAGSTADLQRYSGICEPSGGAFIGPSRFAVASDESNVIRIYERGSPTISASVDLTTFTGYEKSDLEGATARGDTVYWTASQSNSSGGSDKKRKVIFATRIVQGNGGTTLEPTGVLREDLKPQLVKLSGSSDGRINIEGLAAAPDGGLLFGFRNLVDGKAAVVKLKNADLVLAAKDSLAEFGDTAMLDLDGRGIRSLERVGDRYLIVAGKASDAAAVDYALYWWDGEPEHKAVAWETQPNLSGLDPEVAMVLQDGRALQIISDDGDRCAEVEEEDPPSDQRGFSSIDVPL